ncbi:MAG: ATP-binding protein [Bacteriovoracaceae bacterium]
MKAFRQKSSFIERLRIILLIIAAFFVIGIMGLYLSSRGFLIGMQDIAHINRVMNLNGLTVQTLSSSEDSLAKMDKEGLSEVRMAPFREAVRLSIDHLHEAIADARKYPEVQSKLRDILQSVSQYHFTIENLHSMKAKNNLDVKSEILVARQFVMDAEDGLREIQQLLKKESDKRFKGIYERRFDPLVVAGLLSTAFFAFVVIVGLSNARRLGSSLNNLDQATDAVATGDLDYQAPIIEADEFGRLTHAFNVMVRSLKENRGKLTETMEKVTRLQSITNTFSGALLPEEVFKVIELDVQRALKADAGAISLLSEEGNAIELRVFGYLATHTRYGLDARSPAIETIRSSRPMFLESIEDLKENYPWIHGEFTKNNIVSACYIPLIAANQVYGALNFGFRTHHAFVEEEREFILALTAQCAQALHRSKLFKSATDAIQVRDEFLSIASHELRTPLTPLKLQLQNMSRQVRRGKINLPDQEVVLKIMESSDRQVDRLINLIDDLLDVSRISAGKLTLNLETFNFSEMIEEILAHYSANMKDASLSVKLDKSISCYADKVRMEQVLINLLTNAVKYAPKKAVHVTLSRHGDMARLEVRDEGEGISEENQKRIFDRFERVRDKNNIGGLGLGLYICRQIIEAHRGDIRVYSLPGEGATFTVEIPALT